MANANRTNQNRDVVVAGVEFTPLSSGGFITSGNVGLVSISGTLNVRTPAGTYLNLNDPVQRTGMQFTDTVTNPVSSGTGGLWQNSGFVQVRTPGNADIVIGTYEIAYPVVLASLVSGSVAVRHSPAHACRVIGIDYQGVQSFGTSGSATFQVGIQGTTASGGSVTVVTATSTVGVRTAGTAITGANSVGTSGEITVTNAANLSGVIGAGQGALILKLGPPA